MDPSTPSSQYPLVYPFSYATTLVPVSFIVPIEAPQATDPFSSSFPFRVGISTVFPSHIQTVYYRAVPAMQQIPLPAPYPFIVPFTPPQHPQTTQLRHTQEIPRDNYESQAPECYEIPSSPLSTENSVISQPTSDDDDPVMLQALLASSERQEALLPPNRSENLEDDTIAPPQAKRRKVDKANVALTGQSLNWEFLEVDPSKKSAQPAKNEKSRKKSGKRSRIGTHPKDPIFFRNRGDCKIISANSENKRFYYCRSEVLKERCPKLFDYFNPKHVENNRFELISPLPDRQLEIFLEYLCYNSLTYYQRIKRVRESDLFKDIAALYNFACETEFTTLKAKIFDLVIGNLRSTRLTLESMGENFENSPLFIEIFDEIQKNPDSFFDSTTFLTIKKSMFDFLIHTINFRDPRAAEKYKLRRKNLVARY